MHTDAPNTVAISSQHTPCDLDTLVDLRRLAARVQPGGLQTTAQFSGATVERDVFRLRVGQREYLGDVLVRQRLHAVILVKDVQRPVAALLDKQKHARMTIGGE